MKKFLVKTVLLLFPILCLAVFCEVVARQVPNTLSYKNNWLSEHAKKLRIISFGSSHCFHGVDPAYFDLLAFNAAANGQDLQSDNFIFNKFVGQMDSLEYVILTISMHSLNHNFEDPRYWNCIHGYVLYYHEKVFYPSIEVYLEDYPGVPFRKVYDWLVKGINTVDCSKLGHCNSVTLANRGSDWKEIGVLDAKLNTSRELSEEVVAKNVGFIEDIIVTCRQKGVKVILLTTPAYKTYRDNVPSKVILTTDSVCEDLVHSYENVCYLDLFSDSRFNEADFFNADHLNSDFGAPKLSKIINDFIINDRKGKANGL